jgi:hypothetical protein
MVLDTLKGASGAVDLIIRLSVTSENSAMIGEAVPQGFGRRSRDPSPPDNVAPAVEPVRTGENRRISGRVRTLLAGKLIIAQSGISLDCLIRNLSTGGARVRVNAETDLPPKVSLLLVKEGLLFETNVSWRRGDQIGLTFEGRYDLSGDVDPARRGARALWAQLTAR